MATLTRAFQKDCEVIHLENSQVLEELRMLDHALDRMQASEEMFDRLATAKEVEIYAKWLTDELPDHFRREECELLDNVADISPQLAGFAREMKVQHQDFSNALRSFVSSVQDLEFATDLDRALLDVRRQGKALTQAIAAHVKLEEEELRGFL